jgi:hypothetical protein
LLYIRREIDAGQIMIGHGANIAITVPPNTEEFVVAGHCASECTEKFFPETGINVFNVLMHSHLSGSKVRDLCEQNRKVFHIEMKCLI